LAPATDLTSADAVHGLCDEKTSAGFGVHIRRRVVHRRNVTHILDVVSAGDQRERLDLSWRERPPWVADPAIHLNSHDQGRRSSNISIVCSTRESHLARIGEAIDEVAAAARGSAVPGADMDDLANRVAGIWAMVAEIDPALALRLPGYYRDGE